MKSTSSTVEQHLAQFAMEAHGGLMRWNRFNTVSAHLIQGGVFWGAKGKPSVLGDVTVKVDLRNERVSHWPFGSPDRRSRLNPNGSRSRTQPATNLTNSFTPNPP